MVDFSADTIHRKDSTTGILSLKAAWDLLLSRASPPPWTDLVWITVVNPHLACFAWRLLLRKTPLDLLAKSRDSYMASRCYSCHLWEETDSHLFFFCRLANVFWSWLLNLCNSPPPVPLFAAAIWKVLYKVGGVSGRNWAVAFFFHGITTRWLLRNNAKHNN